MLDLMVKDVWSAIENSSAVEFIDGNGPIALTCEHASEDYPAPFERDPRDRRLIGDHWAYDLGAAELTRDLAKATGWPAVLSRFSRLLIDPNRPLDSDTLFRDVADGQPVYLNSEASDSEKTQRIEQLYKPYHSAVDTLLSRQEVHLGFSIHSFTPVYEGSPRKVEVGVLFSKWEEEARKLRDAFEHAGFDARLNEPYSGALGLMYCVEMHAKPLKKTCLELELRQDLAGDPEVRQRVVRVLAETLLDIV